MESKPQVFTAQEIFECFLESEIWDLLDGMIDEGKAVREPALGYEDDGYYVIPIRFKDGSCLFWNDINETWHLRLYEAEKL